VKEHFSVSLYLKKLLTIASGATTIGSAGRAPDKIITQNKATMRSMQGKSLLEPILEKLSTIASGATPIGSAGRAPDEISVCKKNKESERRLVY
jgi:hypothetical protein